MNPLRHRNHNRAAVWIPLALACVILSPSQQAWADFINDTQRAGLGTGGNKDGGIAWGDLNNDGAIDVVVNTQDGNINTRIYYSSGGANPTFSDVTSQVAAGLLRTNTERSVVLADFNNDGYVDLVRNRNSLVEIYLNTGPNATPPYSFGTENQSPNLVMNTNTDPAINTEGIGILDRDRDGWLDMVIDNHTNGFYVLQNTQAPEGGFQLIPASQLGLPQSGNGEGDYSAVVDMDRDGDIDIMGRKLVGDDIWLNQGNGTFAAPNTLPDFTGPNSNKGGIAFCDFDNDGDFDFFYSDGGGVVRGQGAVNRIFINNNGFFTGLNQPAVPGNVNIDGVVCGDVDNDGDVDLFLTSNGPDFLFENNLAQGLGLTFNNNNMGITGNADGEGAGFADFDGDGDLDLLINQDGANEFWRNNVNNANYFFVRAWRQVAPGVRRYDIGAVIALETPGGVPLGLREVNGGRGHGGQDPGMVHFGMAGGPNQEVCVVVTSTVQNIPPQRICVTPADLPDQTLDIVTNNNNPPVAGDDEINTSPGQSVTFDALANDTDIDGDVLTITNIQMPANGAVSQNQDGTLTYTPNNGFAGTDTFSYTVSDDDGNSDTASIIVTVRNIYFTDDFDCSDDNAYGIDPLRNGWVANLGNTDPWRTDINGGVSAITDEMEAGSNTFGEPADLY